MGKGMGVRSQPRLLVAGSVVVGVLLFMVAACSGGQGFDSAGGITIVPKEATPSPTPIPTPTATAAATPTPTPSPNVCSPSDDPATPEEMQVLEPRLPESRDVVEVKSPLRVSGWGSQIAKTGVRVALVGEGAAGQAPPVLAYVPVTPLPAAGQVPPAGLTVTEETGLFAADITFPFTVGEATPVCLWVFQQMASGEPYNVVQVPLMVLP